MLDLNAAPTPSPIVAAPPAAASSAGTVGAGNTDGEAAPPFASVLQGQLRQPQDSAAAKSDTVTNDAAAAAIPTPVDALAILAPMLAGLVAARQDGAQASLDEDTNALTGPVDGSSTAPIAIAAPLLPGIPATTTAIPAADASAVPQWAQAAAAGSAASTLTEASLVPDGTQEGQPVAANMSTGLPTAAILAASTTVAEGSAETGNGGAPADGFAALLDAVQGSQIMAAAHGAGEQRTAAAAPAPSTAVTTPVGAQGWDSEVGEKLSWMVNRQETRADLVLNPPQLGRIEVSLSLNGDQANAVFVSASPAVREALENAVPRLREILQDAGISLGQTQVGAESFQQQTGTRENGDNSARAGNSGGQVAQGTAFAAAGSAPTHWLRQGTGLVDTFA